MWEPMIPPEGVDELAQLSDQNLPHRATVTAPATSGARVGGALVDATGSVLLSGVACRLSPLGSPAPFVDAAQPRSQQQFSLTFTRGTVIPANAIAVVTGAQSDKVAPWTRRVRVVESMSERMATSMARYLCVDAGPAGVP